MSYIGDLSFSLLLNWMLFSWYDSSIILKAQLHFVPDHKFSAAHQANMRDQQDSRRMRDFLSTPFHSMT
jgi:hypothetical protein